MVLAQKHLNDCFDSALFGCLSKLFLPENYQSSCCLFADGFGSFYSSDCWIHTCGKKKNTIFEHGWTLLVATGLLHLGGFFFGYFAVRFLGHEKKECQTVSIEVGMQNSGLGTALASKHFPTMPMAPAPCAMSAILHCLIGSLLASKWSRSNPRVADEVEVVTVQKIQ